MKNKKFIPLISVLIVLFFVIGFYTGRSYDKRPMIRECVTTEEDAISIGKTICERIYPDLDYNGYEWKCFFVDDRDFHDTDFWMVFCSDKNGGQIGGGMPEIHINNDNAEVLYIGLSM